MLVGSLAQKHFVHYEQKEENGTEWQPGAGPGLAIHDLCLTQAARLGTSWKIPPGFKTMATITNVQFLLCYQY